MRLFFILKLVALVAGVLAHDVQEESTQQYRGSSVLAAMKTLVTEFPTYHSTGEMDKDHATEKVELSDLATNKLPDLLVQRLMKEAKKADSKNTKTSNTDEATQENKAYSPDEYLELMSQLTAAQRRIIENHVTAAKHEQLEKFMKHFLSHMMESYDKARTNSKDSSSQSRNDEEFEASPRRNSMATPDMTIQVNQDDFYLSVGDVEVLSGFPRDLTVRFRDSYSDDYDYHDDSPDYYQEHLEIAVDQKAKNYDTEVSEEGEEGEDSDDAESYLYPVHGKGVLIEPSTDEDQRSDRSKRYVTSYNHGTSHTGYRPHYRVHRKTGYCPQKYSHSAHGNHHSGTYHAHHSNHGHHGSHHSSHGSYHH